MATRAYPQSSKPSEYEVKAVYLFNFGKFVQYPANASVDGEAAATFPICILGADPFGALLDTTVADETIDGKHLLAKRIDKVANATGCRVLFISASEEKGLEPILIALRMAPVLTVSDIPNFMRRGGMIQFVLSEDKVRFEVNLSAADRVGLMLSSQLLKVASAVRK